jgi:hypothetical protein
METELVKVKIKKGDQLTSGRGLGASRPIAGYAQWFVVSIVKFGYCGQAQ